MAFQASIPIVSPTAAAAQRSFGQQSDDQRSCRLTLCDFPLLFWFVQFIICGAMMAFGRLSVNYRKRECVEDSLRYERILKYHHGILPPRTHYGTYLPPPSKDLNLDAFATEQQPWRFSECSTHVHPGSKSDPYGPNNSKQLARTGGLIWLHEAEAPKYIYTASLNQRKAVIQREWMAEQVALEKEREKSGDKSKKLPIDVYRAAQQEHEIKTVVPRSVLKPLGLDPNEKTWDVRY